MAARRTVLRGLGAMAMIFGARRSGAQQPGRPAHVGILWPAARNDPLPQKFSAVFHQRMRELGHVEGKTYVTDERFTGGDSQRFSELARELIQAKVAVIVAPTVNGAMAVRQATATIPIVMLFAGGDLPVEQPTRYELFVNLRTAKLLGLTLPQSVLLRADEIVQ